MLQVVVFALVLVRPEERPLVGLHIVHFREYWDLSEVLRWRHVVNFGSTILQFLLLYRLLLGSLSVLDDLLQQRSDFFINYGSLEIYVQRTVALDGVLRDKQGWKEVLAGHGHDLQVRLQYSEQTLQGVFELFSLLKEPGRHRGNIHVAARPEGR